MAILMTSMFQSATMNAHHTSTLRISLTMTSASRYVLISSPPGKTALFSFSRILPILMTMPQQGRYTPV